MLAERGFPKPEEAPLFRPFLEIRAVCRPAGPAGGFRFDLASVFARDDSGQIDVEAPPIIDEILGSRLRRRAAHRGAVGPRCCDTDHPYQSVNFVTCHAGFCLDDRVSYNRKHNEANGQGNRDGTDDNRSWNCGIEGDLGASPEVIALRERQIKNFCALLFPRGDPGRPLQRAFPREARPQRRRQRGFDVV